MSAEHACRTLVTSGRPAGNTLAPESPVEALTELLSFARSSPLDTAHPWELAPAVCRRLERSTGRTPAGGWARLVGLAAGSGLFHATASGFQPLVEPEHVALTEDRLSRRLVEAFTRRLIPPAAAAALYVALDLHPLWGLRLGRDVGSTAFELDEDPSLHQTGLRFTRDIVFGTLAGLLTTLRMLDSSKMYPVDALGEALWWVAQQSTRLAGGGLRRSGIPVLVERGETERKMLTVRLAVTDLLDYVFVPAGVARRDDGGWFRIDAEALRDVAVGDLTPDEQELTWRAMHAIEGEVEIC